MLLNLDHTIHKYGKYRDNLLRCTVGPSISRLQKKLNLNEAISF